MRKILLPVLILALAGLVFAVLKATRPQPPQVEATERVWQIEATEMRVAKHHPEFTLYGRIEAPDRLRAAAPVGGRIAQVLVRDGDRVAAGQALLAMDPRDLEPRLAQARADLEREQIRYRQDRQAVERDRELLALAEAKVKRAERLSADRLGSERDLDQAREDYARASLSLMQREQAIAEHPARLAQLQSRVDEAERDLERGALSAPFAARVGKVEVAAGDQVGAGQLLLTLNPLDGLYLRARLPQRHVPLIRRALAQGEVMPATVNYAGSDYPAQLERLGGESDVRGIDVWLRLNEADEVPVGAMVSARLQGPALEAISLPFSALHGGERIYLIEQQRLRGVSVKLLGERRNGDQVDMLIDTLDLTTGSPVMTTHLPNAIDGLRVEVIGE